MINENFIFFQEFFSQILLHLENTNYHELKEIFREMMKTPPPLNQRLIKSRKSKWSLIKSKLPLFQKSIIEGIQSIPSVTNSLKKGIKSLSTRVEWKNGAICQSVEKPTWGYNFCEIIGGADPETFGPDSIYLHDQIQIGIFAQAPGVS